jgi:electron-transferring-flavoprotein dehydrogenase
VFPGFAAAEALFDDQNAVKGVRIGDMGVEKNGARGPNFALGPEIHAKLTIFAEGCRGSVSKQLIRRYELDAGKSPQTYGLGFKELWQLPPGRSEPGLIQHSLGWPLDSRTYGGSFLYHLNDDRVYVGFVIGLDYEDPRFKPFEAFQQFKHHPSVKALLQGGEILAGGARTIIEGGYQSMPTLEMPGALLAGDAGGTLNTPRIKGIHQAIRSGVCAAEHYVECGSSAGFDRRWRESPGGRELRKVRNIRPGFRGGVWGRSRQCGARNRHGGQTALDTRQPRRPLGAQDARFLCVAGPRLDRAGTAAARPTRLVFFAATVHDENQPVHLRVADTSLCASRCTTEFGNPCTNFCPANVYEMVPDGNGSTKLQINASNCVHCKACDIKEPYAGQITWVTPEGGSGPNYQSL